MKILFIFAHPDDESYGPGGTICKLSKNHEVMVVSLCDGSRPGNEQVSITRSETFRNVCNMFGAKTKMYQYKDARLEFDETLRTIEKLVEQEKPDIVYTHSMSDLHKDHRIVAECCLVACRPKKDGIIKELYFCEMPASTDWSFGKINDVFRANIYEDISEFIQTKEYALSLYDTETYSFPDARSVESMLNRSKLRGSQAGFCHAEAFELIYSKR